MLEEEALITAFVTRSKRKRLIELLANPKRRVQATATLAHLRDLDPRWVVPIVPSKHNPESVLRSLRSRGAGETCWVISENSSIDAQRLPLLDVLQEVIGYQQGTLLSCVPGKLAYFEGEGPSDRCILERRAI